ncbi:MAG TPA: nitroreductase/quinone reductase family protein, partial [Ktedonobacterales bacterium]|nr:nitroreductase/quinone reductase family protein [Ktedonobacterales bacterium]
YVLTASNGGRPRRPGWFFNVRSNPQVSIEVHGTRRRAVAEVAGPEQRAALWAKLLEIAPFYADYEKRTQRQLPMVLVRLLDDSEAQRAE